MNHDTCMVCGESVDPGKRFHRKHWFAMPMPVRKRYWRETDHGRLTPPDDLAAIVAATRNTEIRA